MTQQDDDETLAALSAEDVLVMAERDIRGEATAREAALLRQDALIERWRLALTALRLEIDGRVAKLKADLLLAQQAYMRQGLNNYAAKQAWFTHKAQQEAKIARELEVNKAIQRQTALLKPRLKALHMQQTRQLDAQRAKLRAGITDAHLLGTIQRLMTALTPLASLEYLLASSARDDTHLAAYRAVRLKVGDIRAARAAWLEAQAILGSDRPQAPAPEDAAGASEATSESEAS